MPFRRKSSLKISLCLSLLSLYFYVFLLFQVGEAHTVVEVCLLNHYGWSTYSSRGLFVKSLLSISSPSLLLLSLLSLLSLSILLSLCYASFSGQRSAVVKVSLWNPLCLENIINYYLSLILFSLLSLLSLSFLLSVCYDVFFFRSKKRSSQGMFVKSTAPWKYHYLFSSISASVFSVVPVVSLLFCCLLCAMCSFSGQRSAVVKVVYLYLYYFYYYSWTIISTILFEQRERAVVVVAVVAVVVVVVVAVVVVVVVVVAVIVSFNKKRRI